MNLSKLLGEWIVQFGIRETGIIHRIEARWIKSSKTQRHYEGYGNTQKPGCYCLVPNLYFQSEHFLSDANGSKSQMVLLVVSTLTSK